MRSSLIGILLVLCSVRLLAFDGKEHRRISNAALKVAIESCRPQRCGDATPQLNAIAKLFEGEGETRTYGDLVSSIDYRLDPIHILEQEGSLEKLPADQSQLLEFVREELKKPGLLFLRAAAANDTHFQGELLANLRHWHDYAVKLAAVGRSDEELGTLFTALVVNSFADHFLQDFFAPGHIITPRYGLHDAVALGVHNLYNLTGTRFRIDQEAFKSDLAPLLDFVTDDDLRAIAKNWKKSPPRSIEMWGDSNLHRSSEQELLMTLIGARSILDVVESYGGASEINHLRRLTWRPITTTDDARASEVIERCRSYWSRSARKGQDDPTEKPVLRQVQASAGLPYGSHEVPCEMAMDMLTFPVIAGATIASQNGVFNGANQTRLLLELDVLVYGLPPLNLQGGKLTPGRRQWGLTAGYSSLFSDEVRAHGPTARVLLALPLIHSQFSLDLARRTYRADSIQEKKIAAGIRYQTGFSLLNLDVGIARDYSIDGGRLRGAWVFRTGASLMGPLTSVPGIKKVEEWVYRSARSSFKTVEK